jgi:AraC-like DNA-binding protein
MDLYSFSPYVRHVRTRKLVSMTPAFVDPDYVFTYIQYGSAVFLLEDQKYSVSTGDVVLMPPYMRHIITPHDSINQYVLHFDLFYSPERKDKIEADPDLNYTKFASRDFYPENILFSCPKVISLQSDDRKKIEHNFLKIKQHYNSRHFGFELNVKAFMLEIIQTYLQGNNRETLASKHPKAWRNISNAITYIHENHMRSLDIKELSKHAGLTLNYFCNIFKECIGATPHHYINAVRVQRAKQLMEESNLNFTEIAERTGFSSIYVFSKVFKKLEGLSPSEHLTRQRVSSIKDS